MGPVYSGKGTQAKKLAAHSGYLHVSTGDLCRDAMEKGDELGALIKSFMAEGGLVPDKEIYELMGLFIEAHPEAEGFIFDGFPRTVAQSQYILHTMLGENDLQLLGVIEFVLSEDAILERFFTNNVHDKQRPGRIDDTPEIIKGRILTYAAAAPHILRYMEEQCVDVVQLDASLPIAQISSTVIDEWLRMKERVEN